MSSLSLCCARGGGGGGGGNKGVLSLTARRASCRAKSEASAKRISEREARKGVGGVPPLRELELDEDEDEDGDGGGGDEGGEGWAVASAEVIMLAVDERWGSCWRRVD